MSSPELAAGRASERAPGQSRGLARGRESETTHRGPLKDATGPAGGRARRAPALELEWSPGPARGRASEITHRGPPEEALGLKHDRTLGWPPGQARERAHERGSELTREQAPGLASERVLERARALGPEEAPEEGLPLDWEPEWWELELALEAEAGLGPEMGPVSRPEGAEGSVPKGLTHYGPSERVPGKDPGLTSDSIPKSEQSNTEQRRRMRSLRQLLTFQKQDLNYSKLYEKEKRHSEDLSNTLESIWGLILDVAHKSRSSQLIQALSREQGQGDTQKAVRALIREYDDSFNECQSLEKDFHRLTGEKIDLEKQHRRTVRNLVEEYDKKIADMETDLEDKTQRSAIDVSRLESEIEILTKNHEKELHQKVEYYEKKMGQMQTEHITETVRIQSESDAEKDRMERMYNYERDEMEHKFNNTKAQLEKDSKAEILRLQSAHDAELDRLKTEFNAQKLKLQDDHAQQESRLKGDIEALNGALVAREHLKPLSDHALRSQFLDLVSDIDYVARHEWKYNQTDWTNELLGQVSTNQRKLKKQILQQSMWIVLYEHIFYSPFRVLGEEGQSLETQWTDAFSKESQPDGRSYIWPKPSKEAERWRYETLKKCREALEQPTSRWDPRDKLKKGFASSLDKVKNNLSEAIKKVSNVDVDTDLALENIAKKAAKMWLEFETQRCRILVVMPHSNLESLALDKIQAARLEMVVMPELQRLGNSNGDNLHQGGAIAGCEGIIERVSVGGSR